MKGENQEKIKVVFLTVPMDMVLEFDVSGFGKLFEGGKSQRVMKSLGTLAEADDFDERAEDRLAQFVGCALSGICVAQKDAEVEAIANRAWSIGQAMYNKFNEELYKEHNEDEPISSR